MMQDMLCHKLGDLDIKLDLLSNKNQDMTVEQVFKFVEAKEEGKHSVIHLLAPQRTDALSKSTYFSCRRESVKEGHAPHCREQATRGRDETCTYCGKRGHGCSVPTLV